MSYLYSTIFLRILSRGLSQQLLLLLCLFSVECGVLYAAQDSAKIIGVKLGDYSYMPGNIQLVTGQPVILRLMNTDMMTPHNFIIEDDSDGLDTNVEVPPGKSVDVSLMPLVAGMHTFYCSKKLLFFDSHREKGMEGKLIIIAK